MVLKLVSMPPSQRWLTNGIPQRSAWAFTASRAERLVPTNSTVPPSATRFLTKPQPSEQRHRLLEVDNMDVITGAKNERCHLRIPVTGLMPEMHTSLQHLAHADVSHNSLLVGLGLHVPHATTRSLLSSGTQSHVSAHVWISLPVRRALYTITALLQQRAGQAASGASHPCGRRHGHNAALNTLQCTVLAHQAPGTARLGLPGTWNRRAQ